MAGGFDPNNPNNNPVKPRGGVDRRGNDDDDNDAVEMRGIAAVAEMVPEDTIVINNSPANSSVAEVAKATLAMENAAKKGLPPPPPPLPGAGGKKAAVYTAAPLAPPDAPRQEKKKEESNYIESSVPFTQEIQAGDNQQVGKQQGGKIQAGKAEPVYGELELKVVKESTKSRYDAKTIATIIGGVLKDAAFLGGVCVWIFVFGGGRKIVKDGVAKFTTTPIGPLKFVEQLTPILIDVLTPNGNPNLVSGIRLFQAEGDPKVDTPPPVPGIGAWSVVTVDGKPQVQFSPVALLGNQRVTIQYVLTAVGLAPASDLESDSASIDIQFVATPKAIDLSEDPTDRKSAVNFDVLTKNGNPPNVTVKLVQLDATGVPTMLPDPWPDPGGEGNWQVNATTKFVTFTPKGTVAAPSVSVSYVLVNELDIPSKPAQLKATFPVVIPPGTPIVADIPFTAPDHTSTLNIDASNAAANPGFTGVVKLIEIDAQGKDTQVDMVPDLFGTWAVVANTHVKFVPNGKVTTPAVDRAYVLVNSVGVSSTQAKVLITFPSIPSGPTTKDVTATTTDWKMMLDIDVLTPNGNPPGIAAVKLIRSDGSWFNQVVTSEGTWTVNTAKQVKFQAAAGLTASSVPTQRYALIDTADRASNQAKLIVTFVNPMPPVVAVKIDVPAPDRTNPVDIDVLAKNSVPGFPGAVKLIQTPGNSTTDSIVDGDGHTWTVLANKHITFQPKGTVVSESVFVDYALVSFGGVQSSARITITFPKGLLALDFDASGQGVAVDVDLPILKHVVISNGYRDAFLNNSTAQMASDANLGSWKVVNTPGAPIIRLTPGNPLVHIMTYSVTDTTGAQSNWATITVRFMQMRARAADFLLAADASGGKLLGADVLTACVSDLPKDPKSVKLVGLQDVATGSGASQSLLRDDGKALRVLDEGTWLVDDNGVIAFQPDKGLASPPTPALFTFADNKGNVSNPAAVVIDPGLDDVAKMVKTLAAQTDKDFWDGFKTHVIDPDPSPEVIVTVARTLAGAIHTITGPVGASPVSQAAFDAAYKKFEQKGEVVQDLFTLGESTMQPIAATITNPLVARYWRLDLMVQILLKVLAAEEAAANGN